MEHRLINGGEQFLPFARSRVRALKALGLPYVDQSFEVDGVSIKVRIEPGHEYIRLEGSGQIYMETGQLAWSFPGGENPERLDPAKWHFLDIPTDAKYLGKITTAAGKKLGEQVKEQLKDHPLTEGMDSKAVGYPTKPYPKNATDAQKAAVDAENEKIKASFGERILAEKVMVGYFPASLFSGKLRQFVQAQYGSPMTLNDYGLYADLLGTSAILKYRGKTDVSIQLGIYSHLSAGLFTAPDGSYWLIHIHNPTGTKYIVKAYKIKLSSVGQSLKRELYSSKRTPEEKKKIEAYMLSDAVIVTEPTPRKIVEDGPDVIENPVLLGEFEGRMENAMAYGWKFNTDGSEAKVVVHQFQGTDNADNVWVARTITLTITFETDPDTREITVFKAEAQTEVHGEWTDGWGATNIFVPMDDPPTMGMLEHWSLATNRPGVKPAFDFSNVPVYGYYVDDVWTPVTLTRAEGVPPYPKVRWTSSGISFAYPVSPDDSGAYALGYVPASQGCSFESHVVYDNTDLIISFDGTTINGTIEYGTHTYFTREVSGGSTGPNSVDFTNPEVGSGANGAPNPPGYPYTGAEAVLNMTTAFVKTTRATFLGIHQVVWTLVIPTCDCEAAYIAYWDYDQDTLTKEITEGTGVVGFSGTTSDITYPTLSPGVSYAFTPYTAADSIGGWYGLDSAIATRTETGPREAATEVACFNTVLRGGLGTPGGSYYTLFNVDRNNPFYERGMFTITGAGGRFAMSEHASEPSSVSFQNRFVGWA